jgi:gamma-glutamylcyclotransferase (GGCT)/AIG2-like uncharacterized protein YtfP
MTEYLFSYGTLQKERVQIELFGRKIQGTEDAVCGYTIGTIEIKDESVISKSEQTLHVIALPSREEDKINGTVLELTSEELRTADAYETDDYKRIMVTLRSGKQAWIYVAAG